MCNIYEDLDEIFQNIPNIYVTHILEKIVY